MKEKLNHIRPIPKIVAISFAILVFIIASQTSALAVQPQVAAGGEHTVGMKSDGTLLAVGDNTYGKLNVSSWTDIKQLAAGGFHTVGLKTGGKSKISSMNLPVASYREFAT
jgi:Regulator of chromosome condensation (RCC1) repeat